MFYRICHLELLRFYILYVCQVVKCILGFILYLHFFYSELQQKRLVSPIRKLRGLLEISKVELHTVAELSFLVCANVLC